MPPSLVPDKRMLVGIPINGGALHGLPNLLPGLKASPFEREGAQGLPPGLDQVEIGCIGGLIHKLPTLMLEYEEQQIVAMVHLQVVHDGIDMLYLSGDLLIDKTKEVEKVRFCSLLIALRPAVACRLPQRSIHIVHVSSSIIDLLLGPLGWPQGDVDGLLTGIAPGAHRPHLINI